MFACVQYLRPEPGEALVLSSPSGTSVLRYGRDEPCWSMFPSVFRVPTSGISGEVKSARGLTQDAIEVSLHGSIRYTISAETDSMLIDMAERFWSRGAEGLHELILEIASSIQASVLGEFSIHQIRTTQGLAEFVAKVKILFEREFEPLGVVIEGYIVKEISDHVGYLNALDAIKIADIVKQSRINTAEKALEHSQTEVRFKHHEFERFLDQKRAEFMRTEHPQMDKVKAFIMEEIGRANDLYQKRLKEVSQLKVEAELRGAQEVDALKKEIDSELENYEEDRIKELDEQVIRPSLEAKKEMESEARSQSKDAIVEARKEARHIVLESERKALQISLETKKSLERIRKAADLLKDYPITEFIDALSALVEENGILKPIIGLITNLLKDFDTRRKLKTINHKHDVPKHSVEDESEALLCPAKKEVGEQLLPIALTSN